MTRIALLRECCEETLEIVELDKLHVRASDDREEGYLQRDTIQLTEGVPTGKGEKLAMRGRPLRST